jgi:hypothetical protein
MTFFHNAEGANEGPAATRLPMAFCSVSERPLNFRIGHTIVPGRNPTTTASRSSRGKSTFLHFRDNGLCKNSVNVNTQFFSPLLSFREFPAVLPANFAARPDFEKIARSS